MSSDISFFIVSHSILYGEILKNQVYKYVKMENIL